MNVSMSRTAVAMLLMVSGAAMAQPYGPGASDTEIRLGQTVPFSGPVGVVGQASSLVLSGTRPGRWHQRQTGEADCAERWLQPAEDHRGNTSVVGRRRPDDVRLGLERRRMRPPKGISTRRQSQSCSPPRGPAASGIPKTIPGPLHSFLATSRKAAPWRAMCWMLLPRPRSILYQNDDLGKVLPGGISASAIRPIRRA